MANEHDDPVDDEVEVTEHEEGGEDHQEEEATAKVDSELDEAADDTERDEIRARRKAERKSRAQKHRDKIEAMERNLAALTAQNHELQQKMGSIQDSNVGSQLAQVDAAINQANQAAEHFKNIIAQAGARNDGRAMAEATEYMIASRERAKELTAFKQNATRAINAPKPLNPALISKSQQFLGKNTWYGGPTSNDPDSKVLTALDNSLTAEGWDATSDAYWTELENRAKKYLPHRTAAAPVRTPRNPVAGGNTSGATGERTGTFQLSPDRVAAIKSAGMWDDIATRNKMIKSYRDFDKNSRS